MTRLRQLRENHTNIISSNLFHNRHERLEAASTTRPDYYL